MGTYAVTGAASGMGRATAELLRAEGNDVIGVDLRDVEVVADLSTREGRAAAAARVLELSAGRLDGAVLAAGLGGVAGRDAMIQQVNYFGVVDLAGRGARHSRRRVRRRSSSSARTPRR